MISTKKYQRGEFKVTKVITRCRTEVLQIWNGDPMLTGTVVPCRRTKKCQPVGWHDHPVLSGTTVPPQCLPSFHASWLKLFRRQFSGHLIHGFSLLEGIAQRWFLGFFLGKFNCSFWFNLRLLRLVLLRFNNQSKFVFWFSLLFIVVLEFGWIMFSTLIVELLEFRMICG